MQSENAPGPISIKFCAKDTASSVLHPWKALLPIRLSVDGKYTEHIPVWRRNASEVIVSIPSGNWMNFLRYWILFLRLIVDKEPDVKRGLDELKEIAIKKLLCKYGSCPRLQIEYFHKRKTNYRFAVCYHTG